MAAAEFVEVAPNVRLHIRDWGNGKPVVFIHGWPLSLEMWEYQFTELAERGCRCVGISLRGFGKSSQPGGDHNYDVFADDVKTVLDALDLREVTLVGYSMGGAIALHYTARHQHARVARLVLCGAAAPSFTKRPGFPHGMERAECDELLKLCRTDRGKLNTSFAEIFFKNPDLVSKPLGEWLHRICMEASPLATAASIVALRDADLRGEMSQVRVPTLILHATHDQVCPFRLAEALAAGIPGAKLVPFEASGHGLFLEEREKFNAELMRFAGQ